MKKILISAFFYFGLLCCTPNHGTLSQELSKTSLYLNFDCLTKDIHYCHPTNDPIRNICDNSVKDETARQRLEDLHEQSYRWRHDRPHNSIIAVDDSKITVYLKWYKSRYPGNNITHPHFRQGQAWEISFVAKNKRFRRPYPNGRDHYFNRTPSEYESNLPCAYRDVQNYDTGISDSDFKKAIQTSCKITKKNGVFPISDSDYLFKQ